METNSFVCGRLTETPSQYQHQFEQSLFKAKGAALLILVLVSLVYTEQTKNAKNSHTLLSTSSGKRKVGIDCFLTASFGVFSVLVVSTIRNGFQSLISVHTLKTVLVVSLILGFFCFAQEASGLNRYLSRAETAENTGIYHDIDQEKNEPTEPIYMNDPFISSSGYVMIILLSVFVLVYVINMIRVSACGYRSGLFDLSKTKFYHTLGFSSHSYTFGLELFLVGLINFIPPLISPAIRGEKISAKSTAFALFTLIVGSILQFMLQYSGLFHSIKQN